MKTLFVLLSSPLRWLGQLANDAGGLFEPYHTAQGSASLPVGEHLTIRPEAITVRGIFLLESWLKK